MEMGTPRTHLGTGTKLDLPTPHARVDPLASCLPPALPSPRRLRALGR
jgi:hypothetical protein